MLSAIHVLNRSPVLQLLHWKLERMAYPQQRPKLLPLNRDRVVVNQPDKYCKTWPYSWHRCCAGKNLGLVPIPCWWVYCAYSLSGHDKSSCQILNLCIKPILLVNACFKNLDSCFPALLSGVDHPQIYRLFMAQLAKFGSSSYNGWSVEVIKNLGPGPQLLGLQGGFDPPPSQKPSSVTGMLWCWIWWLGYNVSHCWIENRVFQKYPYPGESQM